jgi:methyl-CpG-binding domain protein 4
VPYDGLLQERYADEPWKLLVSCVLLNQTTRIQVDRVIDELFERYPTARAMAMADVTVLGSVIGSLGFGPTRARKLKAMSEQWDVLHGMYQPDPVPESDVAKLTGVGPYALDSYRLFHIRDTSRFDSNDKEIRAWLERRHDAEEVASKVQA